MATILSWLGIVLTGALLFLTLLPILKTGNWVARICDFPRVQILALSILPIACIALVIGLDGSSPLRFAMLGLLAGIAVWQFSHIVRYTRFWPCEVTKDKHGKSLTVMIVNLDYENNQKDRVSETLTTHDADLLLIIEIDEQWEHGLAELLDDYPHREGVVRGEGLGIVLASKFPMRDIEVRHLVSEERASVHAVIEVDGEDVRVSALHPTPPGLKSDQGDRHDSRKRDAELVLVAKEIQESEPQHRVVMGDLNDVAWSHTTRLFRRLSGLRDPRIGRSLLNTYHAQRPLFRYPLDHIFVSDEIAVSRLERVRVPGSDHFGVLATIHITIGERPNDTNGERASSNDDEEAREIVSEGKREASEHGG